MPASLPAWLDGVAADQPLRLDGLNLLTGKPAHTGALHLRPEQCLDISPTGSRDFIFRPYAPDDTLRGQACTGAVICGRPAGEWLARRKFPDAYAHEDVFALSLYPIIREPEISQPLLDWFFADDPDPALTAFFAARRRVAATKIASSTNFRRYFRQRHDIDAMGLRAEFEACLNQGDTRLFAQDFAAIARYVEQSPGLRRWLLRSPLRAAPPNFATGASIATPRPGRN